MNTNIEKITFQLLGLPVKLRVLIAEKLLESPDEIAEADVEKYWIEEAQRRYKEILNDEVECKTVDNVLEEIRLKLK